MGFTCDSAKDNHAVWALLLLFAVGPLSAVNRPHDSNTPLPKKPSWPFSVAA